MRLRAQSWGTGLALLVLLVLPGTAHACSGERVALSRDLPNADAAIVGTVLMTTTERRLMRAGDPGFVPAAERGPLTGDIELVHTFVRVARVVSGDINQSLVDVVDVTAGCGITVKPGGSLGVLLTRTGSAWVGSRYSTIAARELLEQPSLDVARRSFTSDALSGYGDLMTVLASTHDRPVFAD